MSIQAVTMMCAGPTQPPPPITDLTQFPRANDGDSSQPCNLGRQPPPFQYRQRTKISIKVHSKQYFIKIFTMHLIILRKPIQYLDGKIDISIRSSQIQYLHIQIHISIRTSPIQYLHVQIHISIRSSPIQYLHVKIHISIRPSPIQYLHGNSA